MDGCEIKHCDRLLADDAPYDATPVAAMEEAMDGTEKSTKKAEAGEAAVKGKKAKAAPKASKPPKAPAPKKEKALAEPMVVFAIRVPESERTALHEMAGSGKSTKLVRALIGAAIAADVEGFKRLITTTK